MGADCASACVTGEEAKNEQKLDVDGNLTPKTIKKPSYDSRTGQYNGNAVQDATSLRLARGESSEVPVEEMMKLIRAQSLIRGFLQRKTFKAKKMEHEGSSKYFTSEEAKETVGSGGGSKEITNKKHTYKTGSEYDGEWMGGLRHGQGTMKWADGARYVGNWSYNMASGKGKFFHVGGDLYDGQWANNKANGEGIYTNTKGARYEGSWKDD